MALFAIALVVSLITDLRKRLILDVVTLPALGIVLALFVWLGGGPLLVEALIGAAVCAVPLFLACLKDWMGFGDVKLMALCGAMAGAWAGWFFALVLLTYVSVAGGVQAVLWLLAAKARGAEKPKYVPYGVAIAVGSAAAFVFF